MNNAKPKIIGLTGPIGSGKNEVCRILRRRGAFVIDADEIGHKLLVPQSDIWRKLVTAFGSRILQQGGKVNRRRLGEMVFEDPKLLKKLNEIMHPVMKETIAAQISNPQSLTIINAAVLKEMGLISFVDEVWVVLADKKKRLDRLVKKGLKKEQALVRIKAQRSDREFISIADEVIKNDGTIQSLKKKILELLK
jgi:dephospho-CoA kinase